MTLATLHRYGSRPSKRLIIDDSGDAYLVDETRVDAQKVRIQDVLPQRFLQQLFDHFLDIEAPDGETRDGQYSRILPYKGVIRLNTLQLLTSRVV